MYFKKILDWGCHGCIVWVPICRALWFDQAVLAEDCLLLVSSRPDAQCCVETANLDGETNLKKKAAAMSSEEFEAWQTGIRQNSTPWQVEEFKSLCFHTIFFMLLILALEYMFGWKKVLEGSSLELSSNWSWCFNLNVWTAQWWPLLLQKLAVHLICTVWGANSRPKLCVLQQPCFVVCLFWCCETQGLASEESRGLGIGNLLLRGTSLQQTGWIYCMAVYVGPETRTFKNTRAARFKGSALDQKLNTVVAMIFGAQIGICILISICSLFWQGLAGHRVWYLEGVPRYLNPFRQVGIWFLMLNSVVPISLMITTTVVKFAQEALQQWVEILWGGKRFGYKLNFDRSRFGRFKQLAIVWYCLLVTNLLDLLQKSVKFSNFFETKHWGEVHGRGSWFYDQRSQGPGPYESSHRLLGQSHACFLRQDWHTYAERHGISDQIICVQ